MKPATRTTVSQKSAGEVQLARLQLERAEAQFKSAKEQARAARRRRKEAKQAARRAKKQAKLAKQACADAKLALAQAEANLARSRRRTAMTAGKRSTPRTVPTATRRKTARVSPPAVGKSVKSKKLTPGPTKTATGLRPATGTTKHPITLPPGFEAPTATASMPAGASAVQTGERGGEEQSGETEAVKPIGTTPPESPAG